MKQALSVFVACALIWALAPCTQAAYNSHHPRTPSSSTSSSSHPNPAANSLCAFGPGSLKSRWPIKTSIPVPHAMASPQVINLADLITAPNLPPANPNASPAFPLSARISQKEQIGGSNYIEGEIVETTGYVLSSKCEHDDGDFHVDLSTSAHGTTCAVVEVPNPYYERSDPTLQHADTTAEQIASTLQPGANITVVGQFFFDAFHSTTKDPGGGRGTQEMVNGKKKTCARSLWEIHPVFQITQNK